MSEIPPDIAILFVALAYLATLVARWRRSKVYSITVGNCHISAPTYDELVQLMKLALDTVEVHQEVLTTTEEENQHDQ